MITLFKKPEVQSPPSLSPLGEMVEKLYNAKLYSEQEEQQLTKEIAVLVEERRQYRVKIVAIAAAMNAIGNDKSLDQVGLEQIQLGTQLYINSIDVGDLAL